MIVKNENRPGYKKTKIGWIPKKWEVTLLAELGTWLKGKGGSKQDIENEGLPCVRYGDIYSKYDNFIKEINSFISLERVLEYTPIFQGDILFASSGETSEEIGKAVTYLDDSEAYVGGDVIILRPQIQNARYLAYAVNCPLATYQKSKLGQGNAVVHIYLRQLVKVAIPIPPLPEQKKIAEILSTWDEAIEQTGKLIEAKKRCKKALMQQLLTGKKRLVEKNHQHAGIESESMDWERPKTKDLFKRHSRKPASNEAVLSVTQENGVVLRDSLDRRINYKQTNTGNYKLVSPGDFVISLRSFQGGIEYSSVQGVVSPAYHVIRASKNIEPLFYKYYFKSKDFIKHLAVAIIGIRDGKQVSYEEFSVMHIPHPPIQEQRAIADVLSSADLEIETLDEKLSALKKQKHGLMQKLLTGEIRVITKYILDTCIFNWLLDGRIAHDDLPQDAHFVITHLQIDEINKTNDEDLRARLQLILTKLTHEVIPTETLVFDISRFDNAKMGNGTLYTKLVSELNKLSNRQENNIRDALIAEAAFLNGYGLLTADRNLAKVARKNECIVRFYTNSEKSD